MNAGALTGRYLPPSRHGPAAAEGADIAVRIAAEVRSLRHQLLDSGKTQLRLWWFVNLVVAKTG
jgi:hypothetical protein